MKNYFVRPRQQVVFVDETDSAEMLDYTCNTQPMVEGRSCEGKE